MRMLVLFAACWTGCGTHAARGASQGAARGAVAGAASGLISALIFGGDPAERAARGAAWGASMGGVSGAMAGSDEDRAERERQRQEAEREIARLRREIGEECHAAVEALADCKHSTALSRAKKAQQSSNPNHALAALWIEVLVYADKGQLNKAREFYPALVERDPDISSVGQAETTARDTIRILGDIRVEYGLSRDCK